MRRKHTTRTKSIQPTQAITPTSPEQMSTTIRSLLAEAQALSTRLAALNEVAVAMQRNTDINTMLQVMANQARWVIDFQLCALAERRTYGYHYQVLRSSQPVEEPTRTYHSRAIEQVLGQGHALILNELRPEDDAPAGMRAAMLLPLYEQDRIVGTLNFYSGTGQPYTQDDLRVATALAMQVAAILRNAHLFQEMQRARDELHTVLESISDGVLVIDACGRISLINRAMREILGSTQPIASGLRLLQLMRTSSLDGVRLLGRDTLRKILSEFKRNAAATGDAPSSQGRIMLADGRHLGWVCAPLATLGTSTGYVITVRDISARIALDQLREDMTQMLVHDLRTPLTTIIMGLDLLPLDLQFGDPQTQERTIERTRHAARRLLSQINVLLDVSKLESGKMELIRETCQIRSLLHSALSNIEVIAQSKSQTLIAVLPDDLPSITIDPGLIRRVLENLLGNACKFAPSGSTITIGVQIGTQDQLEIWVQDAGPGVPADMREHIFEKYGQVRVKAREGTGIGLTFCRLVVETHGGSIGVRDAAGGGSLFWFHLPLAAEAPRAP